MLNKNEFIHKIPYSGELYRCWKCNQILKEKDNKLIVVDEGYISQEHDKQYCNF